MGFADKFFAFVGSRWFIGFVGVLMTLVVPFSFQQMKTHPNFMGVAIFIVNILTVLLLVWKFASMPSKKAVPASAQKW